MLRQLFYLHLYRRYLREHEAAELAGVCEDWLRSVAAEEWGSAMLDQMSQVVHCSF